jgi:DNA-binding MarR family transcriptional regulator
MDNLQKVITTLNEAGKPMRAGEIAQASGIEKKDVEKAIKALVKEEKLYSPVRCFYDVKK